MLRLRRVQIEQSVGEEQERLRRVEAHLRALEWSDAMELQDIVIKQTQPIRVAQAAVGGLSHANVGAAFSRLLPQVIAHLETAGVKPGISVGVYEDDGGTAAEGDITLHAGFEIRDQNLPDGEAVHVVDLPVVEVADCRELYHEWDDDDPSRNVMELQQPIAR